MQCQWIHYNILLVPWYSYISWFDQYTHTYIIFGSRYYCKYKKIHDFVHLRVWQQNKSLHCFDCLHWLNLELKHCNECLKNHIEKGWFWYMWKDFLEEIWHCETFANEGLILFFLIFSTWEEEKKTISIIQQKVLHMQTKIRNCCTNTNRVTARCNCSSVTRSIITTMNGSRLKITRIFVRKCQYLSVTFL